MQNQYQTSDFGEVTLAVYHGYEITGVDNSQRRAIFTLAVGDAWRAIYYARWGEIP